MSYECSASDNEGQQPVSVTEANSQSFLVAASSKNDSTPGLVAGRTIFIHAGQKASEVCNRYWPLTSFERSL